MSTYWQAEAGFDWEAYIVEHGGHPASYGRGGEYLVPCPDCGKPKLAVNVSRRAWRCFTCLDGGHDATSLVVKVEGLLWHEAMASVLTGSRRVIGRIDQLDAFKEDQTMRPASWIPKERSWPGPFQVLAAHLPWGAHGINYCLHRRITPEAARGMDLVVCHGGLFIDRLIFPVYDSAARLIFYQGRAMSSSAKIKTLSPKTHEGEAGAGDVLLNLTYAAASGFQRVAIVEGPVDCAHAWPDAVCTFGKKISGRQIELLMRAGIREVDLCFDADASAAMEKVAPLLADIFTVRVVSLPAGKDPGDLTKSEIDMHRANALVWGSGDRLGSIQGSLR